MKVGTAACRLQALTVVPLFILLRQSSLLSIRRVGERSEKEEGWVRRDQDGKKAWLASGGWYCLSILCTLCTVVSLLCRWIC
jgi:hypothetical protein